MWLRSISISKPIILAFCLVMIGLIGSPAHAQSVIERLVEPGPLTQAHSEFEKSCDVCHTAFRKEDQTSLCLDCHKLIATDVIKSMGFHGKSPSVSGVACVSCHTEHEGLDHDIAPFEKTSFDHKMTDYPLEGGHTRVDCNSCHLVGKKYREAPSDCFSCHKNDEPHKGNLGTDCQSCHNVKDWTQVSFNHDTTDFPLLGKHKTAQCSACHADEIYDLPTGCVDCHKEDDIHKGTFGADCESCHTPSGWTSIEFDHRRKTGFALTGGHDGIACNACHTGTLFEPKLSQSCISCHRKDDSHKGRNGTTCADCHRTSSWTSTKFDHNKNTSFPLRGAHAAVACESCHLQSVKIALPGTGCIDCHRKDDPHEGGQGENCASCHNEVSWVENVSFDHDLSGFPLLGKHASAECGDCHLTNRFQDASLACVDCHKEDDVHSGALGPECGLCHNPNGWDFWIFDHGAQTDFALTGAHIDLTCKACHKNGSTKPSRLSSSCIACHRADDQHQGQYGSDCGRCHTTSDFSTIKF